jgi:hypothetical protein
MRKTKLDRLWFTILDKLLPNRIGIITLQEADSEQARLIQEHERIPIREGCLRGVLTPLQDRQAYFKPYDEEGVYYTHQLYAEWAGAVVEAEIQTDESLEILEPEVQGYPVRGWAYRVFLRRTSDGVLHELPEPDKIPQAKQGDCRCPFCLGAKAVIE